MRHLFALLLLSAAGCTPAPEPPAAAPAPVIEFVAANGSITVPLDAVRCNADSVCIRSTGAGIVNVPSGMLGSFEGDDE